MLTIFKLKLKLKNKSISKNPRMRFDFDKLKNPEIAEAFQAQIGTKFEALNILETDIDTITNDIKEVFLSSAEEVRGKERRKIKPWMTTEIIDLCYKRRELSHEKYTSKDLRSSFSAFLVKYRSLSFASIYFPDRHKHTCIYVSVSYC